MRSNGRLGATLVAVVAITASAADKKAPRAAPPARPEAQTTQMQNLLQSVAVTYGDFMALELQSLWATDTIFNNRRWATFRFDAKAGRMKGTIAATEGAESAESCRKLLVDFESWVLRNARKRSFPDDPDPLTPNELDLVCNRHSGSLATTELPGGQTVLSRENGRYFTP
jgi:hypothetical protein